MEYQLVCIAYSGYLPFLSFSVCDIVMIAFCCSCLYVKRIQNSYVCCLQETQKLEAEAQKLEREIENLRKQKTQLQFVLNAHQPSCCSNVPPMKIEPDEMDMDCMSSLPQAMRPSTLPITTGACQSSFDFGLGSTGFTPIVSSSGVGVFLGTGSDIVSPTALLLSPTRMSA